jgi:hypothetical protein
MSKPFAVGDNVWWRPPSREREEGVVESVNNGIMFIQMTAPTRYARCVTQSAKRVGGKVACLSVRRVWKTSRLGGRDSSVNHLLISGPTEVSSVGPFAL